MNHAEAIAKVRRRREAIIAQAFKMRDAGRHAEAEMLRRERMGVSYALTQMEAIDKSGDDFRQFFAWLKHRIGRYGKKQLAGLSPRELREHQARCEELLTIFEAAQWHLLKKRDDGARTLQGAT